MDPKKSDVMKPDWVATICHIGTYNRMLNAIFTPDSKLSISSKWINSNQTSNTALCLISSSLSFFPSYSLASICLHFICSANSLTMPASPCLLCYAHKKKGSSRVVGWDGMSLPSAVYFGEVYCSKESWKKLLGIKGSLIDLTVQHECLLFWF